MSRRGFTLVETLITSGVLLLMVGMATLAVVSYLRSFRHYTEQGRHQQAAARTLESACYRLRSARRLCLPLPSNLQQGPLRYLDHQGNPHALIIEQGKLVQQDWDLQGQVMGRQVLGSAASVECQAQKGFLMIRVGAEGAALPLETQISLRGIPLL